MQVSNNISLFLYSKKGIITSFIISHSILLIMLVFTLPKINAQIGGPAFDLKPEGYSFELANSMLSNMSFNMKQFYLFPQIWLLDFLYPFTLAIFLHCLLFRLRILQNFKNNGFWNFLIYLPFVVMFLDYFENIMISLFLLESLIPDVSSVRLSSLFTQSKSWLSVFNWLQILLYFSFWIIKKSKK